jgi:hypothetical protein
MKMIFNAFGPDGVERPPGFCQELLLGVTVSLVDPSLAARNCLPCGLAVVAIGVAAVLSVTERLFFLR